MSTPAEAQLLELNEQNIDSFCDIEPARMSLLQTYHSNIQTHAAYLIAIIVGALTLFSRLDVFFEAPTFWFDSGLIFLILFIFIMLAVFWVLLRIVYWTSYVNFVLLLTKEQIAVNFNEKNERVRNKHPDFAYYKYDHEQLSDFRSPSTALVIQWAIDTIHYKGEKLNKLAKISLWTNLKRKNFVIMGVIFSAVVLLVGFLLNLWTLPPNV